MILFERFKKKSIEITCPACNGGQIEPALALSTYCRNCGEHLKIIKGVAQLPSGPQFSSVSTVRLVSESAPPLEDLLGHSKSEEEDAGELESSGKTNGDAWVKSKDTPRKGGPRQKGKRRRAREKALHDEGSGEPEQQGEEASPSPVEKAAPPASVAEVFGLTGPSEGSSDEGADKDDDSFLLGTEAVAYEDLADGSFSAMIPDLIEANRDERESDAGGGEDPGGTNESSEGAGESLPGVPTAPASNAPASNAPVPPKPVAVKKSESDIQRTQINVRCFRCHHRQWESKFAESTQCGRCNTYIRLDDYNIRQPTDRIIRTRGNIVVQRKGSLIGSDISCRNLLAMGTISTRLDCSGEARFRCSATIEGHLYCESLVVEKGTIVEFSDGVVTESAEIAGTLRGNVTCAGPVEIHRSGILDGDVKAREVRLSDGGTITGEMSIDTGLKMVLPVVKGYDPSIID